jgi:hypothetical protein
VHSYGQGNPYINAHVFNCTETSPRNIGDLERTRKQKDIPEALEKVSWW